MITKIYIPRLLLTALYTAFIANTALASVSSALLKEDDISLQKVQAVFDAAFFKTEIEKGDNLKIYDGEDKTLMGINRKKKLISFFSLWPLKASVPDLKKLQLVNEMNKELIFVRFATPKPTLLWCDYQFLYEGGITPYTIMNNYRLFRKVVKAAVTEKDTENIIGSDITDVQESAEPRAVASDLSVDEQVATPDSTKSENNEDASKIEIYVTPFYDSKGPLIKVGKYSKGLASNNPEEFLNTIHAMKKDWLELSIEELYVGAIRLYDQEYRDEAVFWFHTAQLRSRVFRQILDQEKIGSIGSPGFEGMHAQNAFYQLAGPYINGYAFGYPDRLLTILKEISKEKENFPDLSKLYPKISFIPSESRQAIVDEVVEGMSKLTSYIKENKESIKDQRIETGAHKRFGSLKSKELK